MCRDRLTYKCMDGGRAQLLLNVKKQGLLSYEKAHRRENYSQFKLKIEIICIIFALMLQISN